MQASSPSSGALWRDFIALCDCGGRRAGSASERKALAFARERLADIGAAVRAHPVRYSGWRLKEAALVLQDGTALACNPLLGSQSTPPEGISAPVCDVGRGSREDFERASARIRDSFVLVRHEYPFSPQHIHRRRKLGWAMEYGAAGFIIAHPERGAGPVAGSSGRAGQPGIYAIGTDYESASRLCTHTSVNLKVSAEDSEAETEIFTLDLPGRNPSWVVLSAHVDGHDLAESAMDNATGVAAVLAVARECAPHVAQSNHGLRVCLFSAEEWALAGSKAYLDAMSSDERRGIVLNINLDTVGGDAHLTALTSEFPRLESFVREAGRRSGFELATYAPVMPNSDHYNFARHGIPAMRLVAGFDRPGSNVRHILTRGDTRDKVKPAELGNAVRIAAALARCALAASGPI